MFRPFSIILKLHEIFYRNKYNSQLAFFRKFNRGNRKREHGRHLLNLCDLLFAKKKQHAFGELDLKSFPPEFYPKGQLVNLLCNMEKRAKKKHFESLRHKGNIKNGAFKSLKHMTYNHNRLEKKLALDKTAMIAVCQEIYEKLNLMKSGGDLNELKKFFKKVKMTQSMKMMFLGNGFKCLANLVKKRKKGVFDDIKDYVEYRDHVSKKITNSMSKLEDLMKNIGKREMIKTFYQLKTGAVVSSKRSFIKKHLIAVLYTLFKKKFYQALRQIELYGINNQNQQNKKKSDALSRIMLGLKGGSLLYKANALRRLREVILYKKNIFKDGKRFNVYNNLWHKGGLIMDESESKLPWVLRRIFLSRKEQGFMGIAAFSRFHLYKTMRGFRMDDELNRQQQNMLKLSKVMANIFFKKRLREGNQLMIKLKDSSFMMKRVYRDKAKDDHDEVVKNTIIIANLVKHFRNKKLSIMLKYFQIWQDETWEYDDEYNSDEFAEEPLGSPHNPLYGSTDVTKSQFARGHQRDLSMPIKFEGFDNKSFG